MSSTGALCSTKVPKRLLVVGGGVIGLELGSVWRRLGAEVTVVEFLDRILPGMDSEVAEAVPAHPGEAGHRLQARHQGHRDRSQGQGLKATRRAGRRRRSDDDRGRRRAGRDRPRALTRRALASKRSASKLDNRGRVVVDAHFATNVPGIYAIGDVIAGPMLAHKAEDEGVAVAEIIAGQAGHVNYDVIPNVVYTVPGGRLGRQDRGGAEGGRRRLQRRQVPVHRQRPRQGQPQTDGFVKILADAKTDRVLGVHIVGADAGNMIAEAAVAMEFGGCGRGHRPHLPRPPDPDRGGQGSRAGGRQARDPHVRSRMTTRPRKNTPSARLTRS